MAHRLMVFEASMVFGWPGGKILHRLRRNPSHFQHLTRFRQAVEEVSKLPIQISTISTALIADAAMISQRAGLLTNDALIVAVMQHHGLTNIASHDADFDRVPGLTRYTPA